MSKRKKTIVIEDPEWVEEKPREEKVDQEDAEMESIARSLPGGVRCISLYRMHKGGLGGRPKFIAQLPPEQFSEAVIQEMYGGGSYFARWQKKDGSLLRYNFDIEGPSKIQEDKEDEEVYIPDQSQVERGGLGAYEMIKLMQESRKEARSEMMTLLELMRPAAQPPDTTRQVFELVEKIVPLIGQGGGDSNPWMFALSQFKEPLSKLVDAISIAASKPTVGGVVQANQPMIRPSQPAIQNPPPQPSEDEMIALMLKQFLPILVNAAAKNADPETYADMVLDQIPESMYPQVKAWLEKPDCLDAIARIEPGIRFQIEWWVALRQAIVEALNEHAGSNLQSEPASSLESEQD